MYVYLTLTKDAPSIKTTDLQFKGGPAIWVPMSKAEYDH